MKFMGAAAVMGSVWSHIAASRDIVRRTALTSRASVYGFCRGVLKNYERGTMNRHDFMMTVAVKWSFS